MDAQFVEGDVNFLDKVVHKVVGPSNKDTLGRELSGIEFKFGNFDSEPDIQYIVSRSVNGGRKFFSEVADTTAVSKSGGNEGEPIGFGDTSDEVCDSHSSTIEVCGKFIECSQIYKSDSGSNVTFTSGHYYY